MARLEIDNMQMATCLTSRKPIQVSRKGETYEGLSGSKHMVCKKSNVRNLGDLNPTQMRSAVQPKRRLHIGNKESDFAIVLSGRESRLHGEGWSRSMKHSKETNAGHVGLEKHLQTSLRALETKARKDEHHRFENLYVLLNKWTLAQSWREVNKRAALGVDKVSAHAFGANLTQELEKLESELVKGNYKANLVRRTHIPKASGGTRPLGIPTVRDKLLQTTCKQILEAIYEPKLHDFRFGYRRGTGPKDAIKYVAKELNFGKYGYVVEADIKGYFQNINHTHLMAMLAHDINDKAFLKLIEKWLKAGVLLEDKQVEKPQSGTPQGGVISPVLANVYLHYVLDLWFEKVVKRQLDGESMLVAYADDFVCAFRFKSDAERFMEALQRRFAKFGLELAKDKTNLIKFTRFEKEASGTVDFLGFSLKWQATRRGTDIVTHKTSKKRFNTSVQNIKQWIKENRNNRMRKLIDMLNVKLKGYYNYYGIAGNSGMLYKMETIVMRLLYKWLNRRSQRKSFSLREFHNKLNNEYPLQKPYIEAPNRQMTLNFKLDAIVGIYN